MKEQPINVYTADAILNLWQSHRSLTRRVIEAFPEKELFSYSIGGMRTFSELVKEFLAIAVPGLNHIVTGQGAAFNDELETLKTKQDLLEAWDQSTEQINQLWNRIPPGRFNEIINLFGQYENSVIDSIQYFIDNEIHHRGQGYVYLRSLGIEPPFFWDR